MGHRVFRTERCFCDCVRWGWHYAERHLTLCAQGESCWQPIEATAFTDNLLLDDIRQGGGCNTNAAIAWMRPFPGDTLGCIQYDDMQAGTHFIRIAKAAIDVDGQIWLWQFIPGSGALLIIVRSVVAGFLLALAVWLVRSLMKQ